MISIWGRQQGMKEWWSIAGSSSGSQRHSGGLGSSLVMLRRNCEDLIDGRRVPAKKNDELPCPAPPPRLAIAFNQRRGPAPDSHRYMSQYFPLFRKYAPRVVSFFRCPRTDGRQLDFLWREGLESVSLHLRCCSQAAICIHHWHCSSYQPLKGQHDLQCPEIEWHLITGCS